MKVHHLNITCKDIEKARELFATSYSFTEFGWLLSVDNELLCDKKESVAKSYVVAKENIFIVLVEDANIPVDTINDIAFSVGSVQEYCNNVKQYGGIVVEEPYFVDCIQRPYFSADEKFHIPCFCGVSPCNNYVQKAVIKSSVGNVTHTLLDKRNFKGDFLPGFVLSNPNIENHLTNNLSHVDHVAFAVPCGGTSMHIKWYQSCLGMSRFITNITEAKSGLVIRAKSGNGLRMLTLEQHPCPMNGVTTNEREIELRNSHVKFVFAESLKDEGSDQVQIFLKHHGGPGVQHIAFHSRDITQSAQNWLNNGVAFIKPPKAYYDEIQSTLTRLQDSIDTNELSDIGILVDAEKHENDDEKDNGYLYQIFTEPVFHSRTFFFELIQRDNATGFGAGNVSALWRALESRFQMLQR